MIKKFFHKILPKSVVELLSHLKFELNVFLARWYHHRAIVRIRSKVRKGEKIHVLFLDSEVAKWKCQSVYELMQSDPMFEPIIGVSCRDYKRKETSETMRSGMDAAGAFFDKLGDSVVDVYDPIAHEEIDLKDLGADIVFYEQSWYGEEKHYISRVCKFALTCCVPYFTPNYGFPMIESRLNFHRFLAIYFLLNEGWVKEYRANCGWNFYSGEFVAVGHPMLDRFFLSRKTSATSSAPCVIYAPHFSISKTSERFKPILKLSTFLENGREILAYAKAHRDVHWIFKPHPVLRTALVDSGAWETAEVEEYFSEWRSVGEVNEEGNYLELFERASVMLTDCGSFLPEFSATGKPIIHLISSRNDYEPLPPSKELFETFYDVHNLSEMYDALDMILIRNEDPKRIVRMAAVNKAGLADTYAAKNIVGYLKSLFGSNERIA